MVFPWLFSSSHPKKPAIFAGETAMETNGLEVPPVASASQEQSQVQLNHLEEKWIYLFLDVYTIIYYVLYIMYYINVLYMIIINNN